MIEQKVNEQDSGDNIVCNIHACTSPQYSFSRNIILYNVHSRGEVIGYVINVIVDRKVTRSHVLVSCQFCQDIENDNN